MWQVAALLFLLVAQSSTTRWTKKDENESSREAGSGQGRKGAGGTGVIALVAGAKGQEAGLGLCVLFNLLALAVGPCQSARVSQKQEVRQAAAIHNTRSTSFQSLLIGQARSAPPCDRLQDNLPPVSQSILTAIASVASVLLQTILLVVLSGAARPYFPKHPCCGYCGAPYGWEDAGWWWHIACMHRHG